MMKKILFVAAIVMAAIGCGRDNYSTVAHGEGTLLFNGLDVSLSTDVNEVTRAATPAPDSYLVTITDNATDRQVASYTVGTLPESIRLEAGLYTVAAQSVATIPQADWNTPVYGASKEVTIVAGQNTSIDNLTCKMLNIKCSVGYNADMAAAMQNDCSVKVEVGAGSLTFGKTADRDGDGQADYGFFRADQPSNTMVVKFSGTVTGIGYTTQTKAFSDVQACQWRKISFIMVKDAEGNATFTISISDWTEDEELAQNISSSDKILGDDPEDPTLGSTAPKVTYLGGSVPSAPITVSEGMQIVFNIKAEKGIKAFKVEIASTNDAFNADVLSTGVSPLDMINPTAGQIEICNMFGFKYGSELSGATDVAFDLSDAITPLLGFVGTHTFTLDITDAEDQRTVTPINLKVE